MPTKIMFIRHAEKPPDDDLNSGIDRQGNPDPESLTRKGWQRAEALVGLFAPANNVFRDGIALPTKLYASAIGHFKIDGAKVGSDSKRPQETLTPLSEKLGVDPDIRYTKSLEAALAADILSEDGVILVCWEHKSIPAIVAGIKVSPENKIPFPAGWPDDGIFDIVWVFDLDSEGEEYVYHPINQALLPGDQPA